MKESTVEEYLKQQVEKNGGEVRKLKWINRNGAPDRIVFLRGVYFVELKRPNKKPTAAQKREHARMRHHGANVCVVDSKSGVDEFVTQLTTAT